jgi:hypothetical protein
MDSAWLSLSSSGYPKANELTAMENETLTLYFTLKPGSDSADAFMFPIEYPSILEPLDFAFNYVNFDFLGICISVLNAWNFFSSQDPYSISMNAYTGTYPTCGIPQGEAFVIGYINFHATDTGSALIDTTIVPDYCGEHRLYYANGIRARDYGLTWTPVPVHVCAGICGDVNGDGGVTTGDGYFLLNYMGSGPQPVHCCASNANGLDQLTPADGFWILNYFGNRTELECYPCEF